MAKSIPKRTQRGADKKAASIKKRQEKERTLLLTALEESPNLGQALTRVGIDRSTYYRWKQTDEVFAAATESAMWIGREKMADLTEVSLLNLAREGNIQAIKFYLQHNHSRYKRYGLFDVSDDDGKLTPDQEERIGTAIKNFFGKRNEQ